MSVSVNGIGQAPASLLSLNPNGLSFGTQVLNTTATAQYFYIYNKGTTTLTLTSETISGTNSGDFAISSNTCTATLAVGSSCYIYITFNPSAVGPRTASVQIVDSASGSPQSVALNGIGIGAISALQFQPANLVFAAQAVSTTSSVQGVQVWNDGNAPVTITGVSLIGGNSSDFAITSNTCPISPATLAVGTYCFLGIDFTPSASGQRTTSLQFSDNLTGSPQLIPITGLGSGSSQILQLSVSNIVFYSLNIGTPSGSFGVAFFNLGNTAITGLAASITGTNASDFFILVNSCTSTLTPGGRCDISVTFKPTAVGGSNGVSANFREREQQPAKRRFDRNRPGGNEQFARFYSHAAHIRAAKSKYRERRAGGEHL